MSGTQSNPSIRTIQVFCTEAGMHSELSAAKFRRMLNSCRKEVVNNYQLYLLVLPALTYIIIFNYIPMYGIQIAFKQFMPSKGIWGSPWIGLENIRRFFTSFQSQNVIWNTVYLNLLSLTLSFPIPITLALLLNQMPNQRFKKSVQTITYAPHFISMVVLVGMLSLFLAPNSGFINKIIAELGGKPQLFMGSPKWFRIVYVGSGIWQDTGWGMILYLATLSNVQPELYESSRIDGANHWQQIRYIDIPVLIPIIIVLIILRMGSLMSSGFEKIYLMQNNMNLRVSEVISTYTYKIGLLQMDYSYSTAVGLFNSIVNFILLFSVNLISNRVSKVGLW
jgi:putative aldouronate transport system permease protein